MSAAADWSDVIPLERLTAWMDDQGLGRGPISSTGLLAGGTQNFLLKFERDGRTYVLRRPPRHLRANSNETMRREARVLAGLKGSDVPHPGLIAACPQEDVIGAAFYLMEPIHGFNASVEMPALHSSAPAMRREMGFSLADGIAALARVDYRKAGLEGLGKLDGYLERQAPRWLGQLNSYAEFKEWPGLKELPAVDDIVAWLESNRPKNFQPGIIHGDYHLLNVMYRFDAPKLAAIVDWELSTLGDPMLDLGWLYATWPDAAEIAADATPVRPWDGFPTLDELAARWQAGTGRDLADLNWYAVLGCFKLGAILEGSHARACAGKAPKEIGDRLHASTIRLFTRAHRLISN